MLRLTLHCQIYALFVFSIFIFLNYQTLVYLLLIDSTSMIQSFVDAVKSSFLTNSLIGILASLGAAVLTLGLGMDTPWAPWDPLAETFYPPQLFTIASFFATLFFLSGAVIVLKILEKATDLATKIWRITGVVFLILYGLVSFGAGTFEAGIMLNILHLVVGIPALLLIPKVLTERPDASIISTA